MAEERQAVLSDLERENPSGDRGADVGADDDPDGLGEGHELAIDEPDHHD